MRVTTLRPSKPPTNRERIAGRSLEAISGLGRNSKVVIGLLVAALVTGLGGVVVSTFGPGISDELRTGPPLRSVVHLEDTRVYALRGGTVPGNPEHIPLDGFSDLVAANNGTPVGLLRMKLVVEGARNSIVTIADIDVRVLERSHLIDGTLLTVVNQGAEDNMAGCVDIVHPTPAVLARPNNATCSEAITPLFDAKRVDLKLDERIAFDLEVHAKSAPASAGYYEFELVLRTVVSGESVDITLRNGDRPFAITSYAKDYSTVYTSAISGMRLDRDDSKKTCNPSCDPGEFE